MSVRESILGKIREGLGRGALGESETSALEERIAARGRSVRPSRVDLDADGLADLFVDYVKAVDTTVDRVASMDEVPDKVAAYLARENLPADLRLAPDPSLEGISWEKRPTLTISKGASDGSHEVGLTGAFAGVAETGTLIMRPAPIIRRLSTSCPTPTLSSFGKARSSAPMKMPGINCARATCRAPST